MMMMILSKSKVMCFDNCPLKYRFIYVDKLPRKPPTPALLNGTKVHSFSENFFDTHKIINNKLQFNMPREMNSDMINILEFEYKRFNFLRRHNRLDLFKPPFIEVHLKDKELGIHGYIDRIEKNRDDTFTLMELKTGNYYPTVKLELDFYRLLCDSNDIDIGSYAVIYSKLNMIKHIKFNGFDTINKMISDTKDAINNNDFEPKKNQWCFNCEFKDLCKFS